MLVMLLGIMTLVRLVQKKNALSPILVTLLPIVTRVRLVQRSNARFPMLATLLGIVYSLPALPPGYWMSVVWLWLNKTPAILQ